MSTAYERTRQAIESANGPPQVDVFDRLWQSCSERGCDWSDDRWSGHLDGCPNTAPALLDRLELQYAGPEPESVAYEPIPPKPGYSRLYVVRWEREDGKARSKVFRRFNAAAALVERLDDERDEPGSTYNARRRKRVQKDPVEWVTLDMSYVRAAADALERRTCACGCGEEFAAGDRRQQYVDGAHRVRAFRSKQVAEAV